jgi:FHA domain-containing protein
MTLTLVAVSLNDQPLSQPITAVFDARGGTIGRADHNTMALPDPQRHVSRLQAEVVAHGTTFLIRNVGAANPIVVSGRTLAHGETATLAQDEEVRIGGYLLKAQLRSAAGAETSVHTHRPETWVAPPPTAPFAAPTSPRTPVPVTRSRPSAEAPFADLLGSAAAPAAGNPFADLLGTTPGSDPFADLMPGPAGVDPRSAAFASAAAPSPVLPDDFDPFASPASRAPEAVPTAAVDPFADLMGEARSASIDTLFDLGAASAADPLAHFLAPAPGAAAARGGLEGGLSTDPMALFGNTPPTPAPEMAAADHVPALHGAFALPRPEGRPVAAPSAHPITPARAEAAAPRAAQESPALWLAFCAGAGIEPVVPAGTPEQQMQLLGSIVRSAVEGMLQLIAVRASTKHELRAGVTVIQQRNNNPLKFSPDAGVALTQLLQPPLRGFLDGPAAVDDAMHDLVGHSIGTVAGLRAAVEGMLDRFAPQALEAKLTSHSMFDNLLPANRKARLWDLYLQHHGAIREEAQEDFHTLFGKAFLAAYEQQIERLQRNPVQR